jgi:hypothetical protein
MKEEEKIVYKINQVANNYVSLDIHTMDEWLTSLSQEEMNRLHRMCNQQVDDMTEEEEEEIFIHSLILYCRELGVDEISITIEMMQTIFGTFCFNVIAESLRRRGIVKSDGPLLLYKDCSISLTEKGKSISEKYLDEGK